MSHGCERGNYAPRVRKYAPNGGWQAAVQTVSGTDFPRSYQSEH